MNDPDLFDVDDVRPRLLPPPITEEFAPTRRLSVVSAVAAQRSYFESLLPLCGRKGVQRSESTNLLGKGRHTSCLNDR